MFGTVPHVSLAMMQSPPLTPAAALAAQQAAVQRRIEAVRGLALAQAALSAAERELDDAAAAELEAAAAVIDRQGRAEGDL